MGVFHMVGGSYCGGRQHANLFQKEKMVVTRIFISFLLLSTLHLNKIDAQTTDLNPVGQTPGGAGYSVAYDSASQRLYVGCGTSIWVYSTEDTSNIEVVARRPLLGLVNEVVLMDDVLFAAATHDGVWALDATSDTLTKLAHYPMTGDTAAYDIWRTNDTIYVADNQQVQVLHYNESNPSFNFITSFGPEHAFCVSRRGPYIAVGIQGFLEGTVEIYRFDSLDQPVASWQNENIWEIQDLRFADLRDDIIYICGGPQNLLFTESYFYAIYLDLPEITAVDSFSVPGIIGLAQANINNLDSQNDTLFISTGAGLNSQLQPVVPVYDASGLPENNMVHLADIRPGLWHFDVARMHGTPFLAMSSEWFGVLISDVSELQPLDTLGFLPTGGWCQRAYFWGDTLFGCMRGYGLTAYPVQDLKYTAGYMQQSEILHIFTQFVSDMAFLNDTLIILSTGELYNLSPWHSGGNPQLVTTINPGAIETIRKMETNAGTRVVAGLTNLLLPIRQIALLDPYDSLHGSPILAIDSTNSNVNGLLVSGDTLFCGKKIDNNYFLAMFRAVNDSLILLDTVSSPIQINGISRNGDLIAVCGDPCWIVWYQLEDNNLIMRGSVFDWFIKPKGLVLKNNLIYLADQFHGLKIYRISPDLTTATLEASFKGTGGWMNLYGSTDVVLGPDGLIGLSDFQAGVILIEAYDSTLVSFDNQIFTYNKLVILPNPAKDQITLNLPENPLPKTINFSLYSLSGKEIFSTRMSLDQHKESITISLPQIAPGLYLVTIRGSDGTMVSGKIVIQ
jgi:hypothetical protein